MLFFNKDLEGRAEKGDIVLSRFIVSQTSVYLHSRENWLQNNSAPLKPPAFWNLASFHITGAVQEQFCKRFRGRWESDWRGWEQRLQSALIRKAIAPYPFSQANNCATELPQTWGNFLMSISGKLTTPTGLMLSTNRRLQAVNKLLIKPFLAISIYRTSSFPSR